MESVPGIGEDAYISAHNSVEQHGLSIRMEEATRAGRKGVTQEQDQAIRTAVFQPGNFTILSAGHTVNDAKALTSFSSSSSSSSSSIQLSKPFPLSKAHTMASPWRRLHAQCGGCVRSRHIGGRGMVTPEDAPWPPK